MVPLFTYDKVDLLLQINTKKLMISLTLLVIYLLIDCRHCKSDAIRFCNAKRQWADLGTELNVEHDPLILPCLHRYAYHESKDMRLKPECFQVINF